MSFLCCLWRPAKLIEADKCRKALPAPSFPLLRLPTVALAEVLKSMMIFELMELSQTSKKAASIVKLGNTKTYNLSITVSDDVEVTVLRKGLEFTRDVHIFILNLNDYYVNMKKVRRVGSKIVPVSIRPRYENSYIKQMNIFHQDIMSGLVLVLDHLIGTFGFGINKVTTCYDANLKSLIRIADYLSSREANVKETAVYATNALQHYLRPILDMLLEKTDKFHLSLKFSKNFQYTFKNVPKEISIVAEWFTMKHVLALDFEKLYVENSNFTNENINLIVNKWKAGDFPKLKHLAIVSYKFNNEIPIAGLMPPILSGETGEWEDYRRIVSFAIDVKKNVEIKKEDGSMGSMHFDTRARRFSLYICD